MHIPKPGNQVLAVRIHHRPLRHARVLRRNDLLNAVARDDHRSVGFKRSGYGVHYGRMGDRQRLRMDAGRTGGQQQQSESDCSHSPILISNSQQARRNLPALIIDNR